MSPGQLIREARVRNGLSQARLARRVGTSQPVISRLESDAVSPTIETLEKVLLAMGERLQLEAAPMKPSHDPVHQAEFMRLSPEQRLQQALSWNRLAGELAQAGARCRAAGPLRICAETH